MAIEGADWTVPNVLVVSEGDEYKATLPASWKALYFRLRSAVVEPRANSGGSATSLNPPRRASMLSAPAPGTVSLVAALPRATPLALGLE